MSKGARLWIALSIIAVFIAGLAGGVLLDKTVLQRKHVSRSKKRPAVHFPTLEIMAEEMGLSQEQQDKIREIFRDNEEKLKLYRKEIQERFGEMRKGLLESIKGILDEEQVNKFDAMIDSYREARKKEYEQKRRKPDSEDRSRGDRG
jgi:uncharacterized protein YneF (UPF0154 family)